MDTKDPSQEFRSNRKQNLICFSLLYFAYGIEQNLSISTLWAYLETLVHPEYIKVWYGLISCSFYLMEIVSGLILSSYVDRSKNLRRVILCCVWLVIIGNVVYILHFSPYYLLLGRIISGLGGGWTPCVIGETNRMYSKKNRSSKVVTLITFLHLSRVVGPGVNILFSGVHFRIASLKVTFANVPGIYMAIFFLGIQAASFFMIRNIQRIDEEQLLAYESFENNLKIESFGVVCGNKQTNGNAVKTESEAKSSNKLNVSVFSNDGNCKEENYTSRKELNSKHRTETKSKLVKRANKDPLSSLKALCLILSYKETLMILFTTALFVFRCTITNMWVPLLVIDDMHLSITYVYLVHLSSAAVFIGSMVPFAMKKFPQKTLFKIYLGFYPLIFVYLACLLGVFLFPLMKPLNASLLVMYIIGAGVTDAGEVLLVSMLSLFLPTSALSRGEGIRVAFSRAATIFGTLLSGVTYSLLPIAIPIIAVMSLVILIAFLVHRESFMNPKPVFETSKH